MVSSPIYYNNTKPYKIKKYEVLFLFILEDVIVEKYCKICGLIIMLPSSVRYNSRLSLLVSMYVRTKMYFKNCILLIPEFTY